MKEKNKFNFRFKKSIYYPASMEGKILAKGLVESVQKNGKILYVS